jgi:DNA-binding GntR family transcriptional regulator
MGFSVRRLKRDGRVSLRNQVVGVLRDAILSGHFKPGAVLNEKELAERLGVSKTPIREALTLLDQEGLVQTIPRKGYIVTPITIQHVHDFFDLRIILESAAAERAALKITDEQLDQLSALVPDAKPAEDVTKRLDRNVEFHHFIARLSGNERLASLVRRLLREMQRMIAAGFIPEEHEKVMRAFRARDPKAAVAAMRDHICAVRDQALRVAAAPSLEHPDAPR